MLEINEIFSIKNKSDFLKFLIEFKKDLIINKDEIENSTIDRYIEAMRGWLNDYEGLYYNMNWQIPQKIPWKTIGFILIASITGDDFDKLLFQIKNNDDVFKLLSSLNNQLDSYINKKGIESILYYLEKIEQKISDPNFLNKIEKEENIPWYFIAQIIDAASIFE